MPPPAHTVTRFQFQLSSKKDLLFTTLLSIFVKMRLINQIIMNSLVFQTALRPDIRPGQGSNQTYKL